MPPVGLDQELEAVGAELRRRPVDRWAALARRRLRALERRLRRRGLWEPPEGVRSALEPRLSVIARSRFPPPDPPDRLGGIAALPLFFDDAFGPVALGGRAGDWQAIELTESGGEPRRVETFRGPVDPPSLSEGAERVVIEYLRYLLGRDLTYWQAAFRLDPSEGVSLRGEVEADLAEAGARVLGRAEFLRRRRELGPGALDERWVLAGIRASDAEVVDRPTLGFRL